MVAIPHAVVDADVLYRRHARNLLVWHALEGLFQLHWSARIFAEARVNLLPRVARTAPEQATKAERILTRVAEALVASGAGSEIPAADIATIEHEMTNDAKDRHVLAAAVACGADTVVTNNTRDFPSSSTARHGIVASTPDDFLTRLLEPDKRDAALVALLNQADFHGWSLGEMLNVLTSTEHGPAIAPRYAAAIRRVLPTAGALHLRAPRA